MNQRPAKLEDAVRSLGAARGKAYWRSLEELARTEEFRAWAEREFPAVAVELGEGAGAGEPSRRRFLQLMGASLALAGVTLGAGGCRRPAYKFVARNDKSAEEVPGRPMYYATTMVLAGDPIGLLVETNDGRPTKIEGNPLHPNSGGATSAWAQASILDLYNPARARAYRVRNAVVTREQFAAELDKLGAELKQSQGKGLAILAEDYASPAVEMLVEHLRATLPQGMYHVYEPARGIENAPRAVYAIDQAEVIVALDCDFLGTEDVGVKYKREFAAGRRLADVPGGQERMNRLYVVEPGFTVTGAAADHRFRAAASEVAAVTEQLLRAVSGSESGTGAPPVQPSTGEAHGRGAHATDWVGEVAADLKAHPGKAVVMVGQRQPASIRELAARINQALGAKVGNAGASGPGLIELQKRLAAGEVSTLLILGGNPAFNAPADLGFGDLLKRAPLSIHLSLEDNETSAACTWHAPAAHYLESWGDARAADGTVSAVQPMIEPLYGGMTPLEMLARLGRYETKEPFEIVRRSFARIGGNDEAGWRKFLHEGIRGTANRGTGAPPVRSSTEEEHGRGAHATSPAGELSAQNLEVCFEVDPSIYDGRFAENAWLQECPDPMTKLTWDNAALLSPKTAREAGVDTGDVVRIELGGRSVEIPAMVLPGLADYSIALPLGYGRTRCGPIGEGVGADAYQLRTSDAMGFATGAKLARTGKTYPLATTQDHWSIAAHHLGESALKDRAIIREATLEHYQQHPEFAGHMGPHSPTNEDIMRRPKDLLNGPHQWGMAVDLTTCVGCSACVIACQAENNIPVVGKDEVLKGREMHWIRMDRYFAGDPDGDVEAATQPMLCQHCENAPCEPVCPVNASVHDDEGLNVQVYNRCIGTRYCSNNCPYKVRRFNFFDYNKGTLRAYAEDARDGRLAPNPRGGYTLPQYEQPKMEEVLKLQKNPNVTVRMRGVMEKCTFCIQRIREAHHEVTVAAGQKMKKKIPDGGVTPACAQACPTGAIVFGDTSDAESRVSQMKRSSRDYEVLGHLNTKPRTTYLARIRNPNPRLAGAPSEEAHG